MYADVKAFRQRFGLGCPTAPRLLTLEEFDFRVKLMHEELGEFISSHIAKDLAESADALVDLVYVVLGTAIEMGLPWDELWTDVQRANMTKVRAQTEGDSKRGSTLDVVKPPGWIPPQGATIIARALRRAARLEAARNEMQLELQSAADLMP